MSDKFLCELASTHLLDAPTELVKLSKDCTLAEIKLLAVWVLLQFNLGMALVLVVFFFSWVHDRTAYPYLCLPVIMLIRFIKIDTGFEFLNEDFLVLFPQCVTMFTNVSPATKNHLVRDLHKECCHSLRCVVISSDTGK